jgi:beta-phosphoglucomutase family hydrolase
LKAKRKFKVFIFDMDGTLVDNAGVHTQVWLQMFAELGVPITAREFHRQTSGKKNPQILRQVLGPDLSDSEIARYAERKESLYRTAYRPHLRLVDGLEKFLAEARRLGVPMAVATSAERVNIDFVLDGLGIRPYFCAVIGSEEVKQGKPHPEAFLTAAQEMGVAAEHCLVFEDSLTGIEAACRAGMKAIAVATTVDAAEFQGLPTVIRVVKDFTTLGPRALLEIAPGKRTSEH